MPNIAIYSQKNGDEIQVYLHQFILELEKRENVQIFLHEKILENSNLSGEYQIFSDKNSLEKCEIDYFFSFGGDGTILSALTLIQDLEIPVVISSFISSQVSSSSVLNCVFTIFIIY